MLVLTRQHNQKIIIQTADATIEVMVSQICGDKVRLGIVAPPRVKVLREELLRRRNRQ